MKKTNKNTWWLIILLVLFITMTIKFAEVKLLAIIGVVGAFISGALILQGILIMGNNPPMIGLTTRWGKRLWSRNKNGQLIPVIVEEGWNWLFLKGFMFGIIPVSMLKREHDFPEYILRTPDQATTGVPVGIAFLPNRDHIINYLDLGKNDVERNAIVLDWFDNLLGSELRQWAISGTEGPKTWKELGEAKDQILDILLERVLGVQLTPEQKRQIKVGRSKITIQNLGIDLIRLNLPPMRPHGPVYDASLRANIEEEERNSETFEVGTDLEKAKLLKAELQNLGANVSIQECMDRIMEWKIRREANGQLSLSALAQAIAGSIKGGK